MRRAYAHAVDGNQTEIANTLRRVGVKVFDLSGAGHGVPDLLCWHPRCGYQLLEVKRPGPPSAQKLTPAEKEFAKCFPVHVVVNVKEALAALNLEIAE